MADPEVFHLATADGSFLRIVKLPGGFRHVTEGRPGVHTVPKERWMAVILDEGSDDDRARFSFTHTDAEALWVFLSKALGKEQ